MTFGQFWVNPVTEEKNDATDKPTYMITYNNL